jgi:hypothetical protein
MGDLGLPGSVVEMPDAAPQKALWEVRKAGLNIMMSLKGDGKPVSFIEDCAVPLEHLAEYTDALTEVFAQARHARHLVRARLGRHAARAADPRHAPRRRAKMRAIAEEACAGARIQGRLLRRARRRPVRGEWIAPVRPAPHATRSRRSRTCSIRRPDESRQDRRPAEDGRRSCSASSPATATLSRSRQRSTGRPGTCRTTRSPRRWRPAAAATRRGGFAKAVEMCNNNGHCRKFDAGTMCPSYRVTRDEQHLTRGRANTLRLALSGQLGPDALTVASRCARRWTCASAARAASANARPASTWRR